LDWKISGLRTLEDAIDIGCAATKHRGHARAIAHQTAGFRQLTPRGNHRQPCLCAVGYDLSLIGTKNGRAQHHQRADVGTGRGVERLRESLSIPRLDNLELQAKSPGALLDSCCSLRVRRVVPRRQDSNVTHAWKRGLEDL